MLYMYQLFFTGRQTLVIELQSMPVKKRISYEKSQRARVGSNLYVF